MISMPASVSSCFAHSYGSSSGELFILGRFRLVNRENMMAGASRAQLQQSGLVDERQVVQLGKWLSAN